MESYEKETSTLPAGVRLFVRVVDTHRNGAENFCVSNMYDVLQNLEDRSKGWSKEKLRGGNTSYFSERSAKLGILAISDKQKDRLFGELIDFAEEDETGNLYIDHEVVLRLIKLEMETHLCKLFVRLEREKERTEVKVTWEEKLSDSQVKNQLAADEMVKETAKFNGEREAAQKEVDTNYKAFQVIDEYFSMFDRKGYWALMSDGKLIGIYPNSERAHSYGVHAFGEGKFSIQEIGAKPAFISANWPAK